MPATHATDLFLKCCCPLYQVRSSALLRVRRSLAGSHPHVYICLFVDNMADSGRGGFGRGFGGRGDRGRGDRGRGRGRGGRRGRKDEEEKWVPCTKLGRLVQQVRVPSAFLTIFVISCMGHGRIA